MASFTIMPFLLLEAFYLHPIGPLSTEYTGGAGGYAGLELRFADRYALMMRSGWVTYLADEDEAQGHRLAAVHLLTGPRYYLLTGGARPHVGMNVGVNLVLESAPGTLDRLTARLAWQLLLGAMFPIDDRFAVDVTVKYNAHFFEAARMMTGFELGLALTF